MKTKRHHKLLTKELERQFPPLYANEGKDPTEVLVVAKFFCPYTGNMTWYATEYDGEDLFFGLVEGQEKEMGYFSLSELESSLMYGYAPAIERDMYFGKHYLSEFTS